MEVLSYDGDGYKRLIDGQLWTVAALNYAERFDESNLVRLERHLLTDEAFVLLDGSATLIVGMDIVRVPMTCGKVYNVRAGEWHHILVKPGSHVLIMENSDTGKANTEYREILK